MNIVVLWGDGYSSLVDSLRTILEDIISINGYRTTVTFVCSTPEVQLEIKELVQQLQKSYWQIISTDRVYVAPPYVLSRQLSYKLPNPYQSEDDYQVPHSKRYGTKYETFPDILPPGLRQNISSHLQMLYMKKERKPDKHFLDSQRKKFYSGMEIADFGLRNKFGIEREKMGELEREFKSLTSDKKSHVSILCLKVDRGAGSSTLCLQFLYKNHEQYPCAYLLEIGDNISHILSCIRDINNVTRLPLLLFVDEEISHPQDFLDFTKELVECRNINVILLLIVPAEVPKTASSIRMKNVTDSSTLRACPFRMVELRRELLGAEMKTLTEHLVHIKKEKKISDKLNKLKNRAMHEKGVRTFAHFGLTAFGQEFLGLKQFVEFRLNIADDKQKTVLAFLSLVHIYTDSHLPASALCRFLETKKTVNLEHEFQDHYLRELLSPAADKNDSRRISFLEVAEEILAQLATAKSGGVSEKRFYWLFIKDTAVEFAKQVLSVNIKTTSIDRLTRRLFVTSEYDESEKFSSLIRAMKDANCQDIARDTLTELKDVFVNHPSFRAHILAHLAKYYMIVAKDFDAAKPRIEEAIKDQPDDPLLRHIHGDIILRHVKALKKPVKVDMDVIVKYAKESSDSFKFVRRKRSRDSHGYISDAMVRIIVMQAAMKHHAGELPEDDISADISFVDYLVNRLKEIHKRSDRIITKQERYLISLIPKAHEFLFVGVRDDFEHKEDWKRQFRKCIGPLSNLRLLCSKIREVKNIFHDVRDENSMWLYKVLSSIQSLNNGFEIDCARLTPEQIEERIKEVEECAVVLNYPESLMKWWIRYRRNGKNVPNLDDVKKKVKRWLIGRKKHNRSCIDAEYYR